MENPKNSKTDKLLKLKAITTRQKQKFLSLVSAKDKK